VAIDSGATTTAADPLPALDGLAVQAHTESIRTMFKPGTLGLFWGLTLLCCCTAENTAGSSLPTEVTINQEAGRGGWLVVTLRLESGGELPFVLDTQSC